MFVEASKDEFYIIQGDISPWSVQWLGQMCPKYWKLKKDISSIWSSSGGGS